MVFTSFKFLAFLLAIVIVFFLFPAKYRWIVLLLGSCTFYGIAGLKYIPFMLTTTIVSYVTALYITSRHARLKESLKTAKDKEEKSLLKEKAQKECKRALILSLNVSLGILLYTKFFKMLLTSLQGAMGADFSALKVIVPLGVSYYTFSTIGYVLDVYWERYDCEKNFFKYLLFVIYFPHILQGPIARYNKLGVQLCQEHRFDYDRVAKGLQLMAWGFFQKLVIADRVSMFVASVYGSWKEQTGLILFVATLFYAVQIYTDFSGCVDIARGMSQIFGIEIEENFRQPYFSKSVAEFWRRWHITLGAWFKDYLCMPVVVSGWVKKLSKNVRNKWGKQAGKHTVTICSLAAVWICTGLWHGTGLNYVIWGIWQGGIIIFSTLMEPNFVKAKQKLGILNESISWQRFCIVRTFFLTGIIPRVITRAESIPAAFGMFKKMLTNFEPWVLVDGSLFQHGLDAHNFIVAILAIMVLFFVSKAKENGMQIRNTIAVKPLVVRWIIYYAIIIVILVFGIYGPEFNASSFVYMQF